MAEIQQEFIKVYKHHVGSRVTNKKAADAIGGLIEGTYDLQARSASATTKRRQGAQGEDR